MNDGPYRGASTVDPEEPPVDPNRPWELQTWTSRRECPQCRVALFAARKEGYRVDACATCGGAWLDHATSTRAVADRNLTPAQLAEVAASHAPGAPTNANRHCPICTQPLRQRLVPEARVVIDVCDAHGAWYDPDELRTVIESLVRANPPPLDPEVEMAIEQEAFKGQFRPPENYGSEDAKPFTAWDVFTVLFRSKW